jgi:MFS family permease
VAFAFLVVMMFATLPSPLYGLYRTRDHLSAFTITVVFAIFAGGTISTLLAERSIVARFGRRGAMLGGVATMMVAAGLLAAWKALPGLLIGRLLTGVAIGLATGVAIPCLIELWLRADPNAPRSVPGNIGTAANMGALGIGPLLAGFLAQWVMQPLTFALPPVRRARRGRSDWSRSRARDGRASTASGNGEPADWFAACGPASSPSSSRDHCGLLCDGPVRRAVRALPGHHAAPALPGTVRRNIVPGVSAGAASQLATTRLRASRVLALGMTSLPAGLVLLVVAVRLPATSLVLFLIGSALIGAGAGAVYKGTTGLVLEATEPENRVAMTSALVIAVFVGLSVPVIGAGVALTQGASPPDAVLGFVILVALGISVSGWAILGRRSTGPQQAADLPDMHS